MREMMEKHLFSSDNYSELEQVPRELMEKLEEEGRR